MLIWKRSTPYVLLLAAFVTFVRAGNLAATPAGARPAKQSGRTQAHAGYQSDGERVFMQNCARCHDAPQSFAQQVSGTIVRHMRVRASLSRKDEQDLLKFLNP